MSNETIMIQIGTIIRDQVTAKKCYTLHPVVFQGKKLAQIKKEHDTTTLYRAASGRFILHANEEREGDQTLNIEEISEGNLVGTKIWQKYLDTQSLSLSEALALPAYVLEPDFPF